jgi:hypothetical protein
MNKKDTNQRMHLLVYPAKDMAAAKRLFSELLGVAPYAEGSFYTGFRTGDLEVGIDPNGRHEGPVKPFLQNLALTGQHLGDYCAPGRC